MMLSVTMAIRLPPAAAGARVLHHRGESYRLGSAAEEVRQPAEQRQYTCSDRRTTAAAGGTGGYPPGNHPAAGIPAGTPAGRIPPADTPAAADTRAALKRSAVRAPVDTSCVPLADNELGTSLSAVKTLRRLRTDAAEVRVAVWIRSQIFAANFSPDTAAGTAESIARNGVRWARIHRVVEGRKINTTVATEKITIGRVITAPGYPHPRLRPGRLPIRTRRWARSRRR